MRQELNLDDYLHGIKNQDIGILSRAISLVESKKNADMLLAAKVLKELSVYSGKALRIGVTGIPGAGKSTFINQVGKIFCEHAHKVAVLSIDPSSSVSGGSILGDKTRMQDLSFKDNAYVRPSPSLGHLGGVAARTRESILLCEAYGFDYIFVESVGVGQSELEISAMVDLTILLSISGAGDELQGIKRGLLEAANWILINKADGDNLTSAKKTKQDLKSAIGILKQEPVFIETISSLSDTSATSIYQQILNWQEDNKDFIQAKRKEQKETWFLKLIEQKVLLDFRMNETLQAAIQVAIEKIKKDAHPLELISEFKI